MKLTYSYKFQSSWSVVFVKLTQNVITCQETVDGIHSLSIGVVYQTNDPIQQKKDASDKSML